MQSTTKVVTARHWRRLAVAVASLLAPNVAHAGANATAEVEVTAIRLVAPRLSGPTGQTQVVAGAPQTCVFNPCSGIKDATTLQVIGEASAEILLAGERVSALAHATGGVPSAGLVRASTQADGVGRTKADAGARGQFTFSFLSASACTTATLSVDYAMLQDLRSQPGPERAFGDQSLDIMIQNVDMGFVQDTDSIRVVNDRFSGDNVLATPSGTLSVTVPCSGIDQITGRITWFAAAIAQASTPAPGQTAGFPLLPLAGGAGTFTFPVVLGAAGLGTDFPLFLDPPVATGYHYAVEAGEPRFASVLIPEPLPITGDDAFRVVFGGADAPLAAGSPFSFTDVVAEGVSAFEIRDIDPAEALDPADPLAFVTGLTFTAGGAATITMTPIVPCGNGTIDPGETCDDGNTDPRDGCDPMCQTEPPCRDGSECDDGLFCNGPEQCTAGTCGPGAPPDCGSLDDACHAGTCDEQAGACVAEPANEGGGCDDGDPCTVGETCAGGACGGGTTAPACLPTTTTTGSSTTTTTTLPSTTITVSTTTSTTTIPSTTTTVPSATTTSTIPVPATTSTSLAPTTTTTLPPPVPCDLPPFPRLLCHLKAASQRQHCAGTSLGPQLARALTTGFGKALSLVQRAEEATAPRRRRSLLGKANVRLGRIVRATTRAARHNPDLAPCATDIGATVGSLRALVAELRVPPS